MYPVFDRLVSLLDSHGARYRVLQHDAEGQSFRVADIRGTEPGQGAKAMLCALKGQAERYALAILPGDHKLDMKKLGAALGGKKAELVKAETAMALTGCRIGAIPPFVFDERIELIVDPSLTRRYEEIAFNAGRLDASMILASHDYLAITQPRLIDISQA
ncbi:YbaK/prolyl-tRNA synthetase associated domain-containing protein [Pseudomonas vanderleydeniana]|uniref:YbaK/prolyl-tRNA synthetase associated domain-containing protein n=1 Tax=Pseudomonas vanderleydeniana TaxID=2745495 RepID=A0A9E6PGN9_9PSED|nr:YbaK/prolyl-tRNA synthetase associated domain-containing protein [Pseudomonas vanderleydeniana]QXI26482.1 YbaK/prolyl-tRNA synthetase associated domain-containing protein [Pseudomonas vanderleydeniana]